MANILDTFDVQEWHCFDERLPKNPDLKRIPPDPKFMNEVFEHGILQPPMMGWNEKDGWFIVFGRKRLMAVRYNYAEGKGDGVIWIRVATDITRAQGHILSMVENAQRSKNPISDYLDIRAILRKDKKASYKTIAEEVGVTTSYVKTLDEKYGRVPGWTIDGALADKIAETVMVEVGRLSQEQQDKAEAHFKSNETLPMSFINDLKRFKREEFSVAFSQALGMTASLSTARDFIPADELHEVKKLLEEKNYKKALETINRILS